MLPPKPGKTSGRDAPIEDPRLVGEAMQAIMRAQTEFPIKVEGASTLPYTSVVKQVDFAGGTFVLNLIRPLPHELMSGATFRMVFAVEDQRYEGLITFIQRESYLHYSFRLPSHLFYSDRRSHKRFPFRPRENAYVIAQDGGVPGLGVAGPLANIGMGGLAMRVDRTLKLDDGMRIPPSTANFDRGKTFVRVRVHDLPHLPMFDVSGWVAHISERGSELILGFAFRDLDEEENRQLKACLDFREKVLRGAASPAASEAILAALRTESQTSRPSGPEVQAPVEDDGSGQVPLALLQRRTARFAVAMPPGPRRDKVLAKLRSSGYLRYELVDSLVELPSLATAPGKAGLPLKALVADLSLALDEVGEPLAAVRLVERQAQELGEVPMVILCDALDPTMYMAQERMTRFLSMDEERLGELGSVLDAALEPPPSI